MLTKKYKDIYDASCKIATKISCNQLNVIVDLGARHGEGYDRLGKYFKNAKYIFVEPSPRCIPIIIEKMKHIEGDVELIQGVLGNTNRVTNFHLLENDNDQSGNMYTDRNGIYGQSSIIEIDVYDYKNFISNLGHIDFLKCNIEGGEYELIETSFFDHVTSFVIEAHNRLVGNKTYIDIVNALQDKFDMEIWGDTSYKYCFINGIRKA